jgi:hypothetical protein
MSSPLRESELEINRSQSPERSTVEL